MLQLPQGWGVGSPEAQHKDVEKVLFRGKMYKRCPPGFAKDLAKKTCVPSADLENTQSDKDNDGMVELLQLESGSIYYNPQTNKTFKKLNPGEEMSELEQELFEEYGKDIESVNDKAVVFDGKFEINLASNKEKLLNKSQRTSLIDSVTAMHKNGFANNSINAENILLKNSVATLGDFSQSKKVDDKSQMELIKDIRATARILNNKANNSTEKLIIETAKKLEQAKGNVKVSNRIISNYRKAL